MARTLAALLIVLMVMPLGARAEDRFGPFSVSDAKSIIVLSGDLDARAALHFRRAMDAAPEARTLLLNSPGGLVQTALLIADDIHRQRLNTLVPPGSACFSACSFLFFAGEERIALGKLGVHQVWGPNADASSAQVTVSDILEVLSRFDTPMAALTKMLRTPPDEMYIFSSLELTELGLNRQRKAKSAEVSARLFDHNGSVIRWVVKGSDIEARYHKPRPGLEIAGVSAGTLLFEGKAEGESLIGTAYAFKQGCSPAGYSVLGRETGGQVVLSGPAPRRQRNGCGVTTYSEKSPHAVLTFELVD